VRIFKGKIKDKIHFLYHYNRRKLRYKWLGYNQLFFKIGLILRYFYFSSLIRYLFMLSDKLIQLLKSFSKVQLNQFRKYLISPFFNENQRLIQFFDLIYQSFQTCKAGEGKINTLEKKAVWKILFQNKPYKDSQMRRLSSDLTREARHFLAYSQFKLDPMTEQIYLLPAVNEPRLTKHFISSVRQAKDVQRKMGFQNSAFHYNRYQLEYQCQVHLDEKVAKENNLTNLGQADFHLECFYIINKLRHYSELVMWKNVRSFDLELHFFPGFMDYIEQSTYIEIPAIAIQFRIVKLFLEPEQENNFYKLRALLVKNNALFQKEELRKMYLTAQNYCAYQINLGNLKYYKELFEIYKTLIEKEIILSKGEIAAGNYKNIITVGLMVDEPEWVESFIEKYTDTLPKINQDNDRNYNLAKVYFHQKRYEQVIEQLREVEYKTLVYVLGGRLMLLKTYYELHEESALDSLIDSFRIYLRRNQLISRDVRQQYLNVLRFVKKLATTGRYNKASLIKTKQQINQCKALAAKQWLLEKVEELE